MVGRKRASWGLVIGVGVLLFGAGWGRALAGAAKEATLQDVIKARTDVMMLLQEVAELPADVRGPMRKVIVKAEAEQMAANILLTKDKYTESVEAFDRASALYRQALGGKKLLERLGDVRRKVDRARLLAEAGAAQEKLAEPRRMEINAEGYIEAAEFEKAISEFESARKAYEALLAPTAAVTLEEVVAARTAMLAARKLVKDLPALGPGERFPRVRPPRRLPGEDGERIDVEGPASRGPRKGSLPDVLGRARQAESGAAEALEQREYTPALRLFQTAEKLFREAAALQLKRESVLAARKTADDAMKMADKAFKTEARPASFERGKQALADGDKALAEEEDLDGAKKLFAQAVESFAKAHAEAELSNELAKAQEAWGAALAGADQDLVGKHAAAELAAAKKTAAGAEAKAAGGDPKGATALYAEATDALKNAIGVALTKENEAKAAPIIERIEAAIARKDRFGAEDLLAEAEKLIPKSPKMPSLRERVAAVPGPKPQLTIDLGGGVTMELVLIRPGSFDMGSTKGDADEKPVHKVTIKKPFYIGKYEVTQEQWQAIMGANPSNFKDPKKPVENVSWNACQDFVRKLAEKAKQKVALPSEAEWEYACRAGSTTEYCFGNAEGALGEYAWFTGNSNQMTHPVGQKKPNKWGLFDMHGNVWEWCEDVWHDSYEGGAPTDGSAWTEGGNQGLRVLRGGAWRNNASNCRSAARNRIDPTNETNNLYGCRVVLRDF